MNHNHAHEQEERYTAFYRSQRTCQLQAACAPHEWDARHSAAVACQTAGLLLYDPEVADPDLLQNDPHIDRVVSDVVHQGPQAIADLLSAAANHIGTGIDTVFYAAPEIPVDLDPEWIDEYWQDPLEVGEKANLQDLHDDLRTLLNDALSVLTAASANSWSTYATLLACLELAASQLRHSLSPRHTIVNTPSKITTQLHQAGIDTPDRFFQFLTKLSFVLAGISQDRSGHRRGSKPHGNNSPGRNSPCPCGSGRKRKKCCLKQGASTHFPLHDASSSLASSPSTPTFNLLQLTHLVGCADDVMDENPADAILAYSKAIDHAKTTPSAPEILVQGLLGRACAYAALHQTTAMDADFKDVLALVRPGMANYPTEYVALVYAIATLYWRAGVVTAVEPLYREALDIRIQQLGSHHPDVADSLNRLSELLIDLGRYHEAEGIAKDALQIRRATLPPSHPGIAISLNNLGNLYLQQGRFQQAEELLQVALNGLQTATPPQDDLLAQIQDNLATLHMLAGQPALALPFLEQAADRLAHQPNLDPTIRAGANLNLAVALHLLGRLAEARASFDRARTIIEQSLGPHNQEYAKILIAIAGFELDSHDAQAAEAAARQAITILQSLFGTDHIELIGASTLLAESLLAQGRGEEALTIGRQAENLARRQTEASSPHCVVAKETLIRILDAVGQHREAATLKREQDRITRRAR